MLLDFALPEHERKLIPEGRVSGSMPWVIAIMTFLTVLAGAAGLMMLNSAQTGSDDLSRTFTVQIVAADPALRRQQKTIVGQMLQQTAGTEEVTIIPEAEIRDMLIPWLGEDVVEADIPVPALIELRFDEDPSEQEIAELAIRLEQAAPGAKINSQAIWLAPFFSLMNSLLLLTAGILMLLLLATAATVMLAVRSALNTHKDTIGIMHMLGGTDLQAARLFQRRMALDALLGGVVGFAIAVIIIWLLSMQFNAAGSSLLTGAIMPWYGWLVIALIPLAVMGLAMLIARRTVLSALKTVL